MYRIATTIMLALLLALAGTGAALAEQHADDSGKAMESGTGAAEETGAMESEGMESDDSGASEGEMAAESEATESDAGVDAEVARAVITSEVIDREPVDDLGGEVANDLSRVFYFTEIRNGKGSTITHRWEYNGEVKAEVDFEIGGDRWRVWSSKQMLESWTGQWRVSVVTANGTILKTTTFDYVQAEEGSGDDMGEDMSEEDMSGDDTSDEKETGGGDM